MYHFWAFALSKYVVITVDYTFFFLGNVMSKTQFEGILHLSDDDISEDSSPIAKEDSGDDNLAGEFEPHPMEDEPHLIEDDIGGNLNSPQQDSEANNTNDSQGDPDYFAYLQTLVPNEDPIQLSLDIQSHIFQNLNDLHNPIHIADYTSLEMGVIPTAASDLNVPALTPKDKLIGAFHVSPNFNCSTSFHSPSSKDGCHPSFSHT